MNKNDLLDKLKTATDIVDPDSHCGAYELVRTVVGEYEKHYDDIKDKITIGDIYLILSCTLLSAGDNDFKNFIETGKSISSKEDQITKKRETVIGKYTNVLPEREVVLKTLENIRAKFKGQKIGMFTNNEMNTMKADPNNNHVKLLMELFINLYKIQDVVCEKANEINFQEYDEECIKKVKNYIDHKKQLENKGEKILYFSLGGFSQILHCLKPTVFPILNAIGRDGFKALKIQNNNNIDKYIDYIQGIKDLRDKDLPNIKNYRTIDRVFWDNQDLIEKINNTIKNKNEEKKMDNNTQQVTATTYDEEDLNIILYGPPGTGKTYNSVIRAVEIIDKKKFTDDEKKNYKDIKDRYRELEKNGQIAFVTFHQSYGYEDFIVGIKPKLNGNALAYEKVDGVFKRFCDNAKNDTNNKYVFIIDEINRGNVSKIFGELITLIECSKRMGNKEAMTCVLPNCEDDDKFGVPNNVYILGTMNTADRSLVQLDTALRRRFVFEEMMPIPELLKGKMTETDIALDKLLEAINERIKKKLDREHQIGHSYFMDVKTLAKLNNTFKKSIIPLLQEYFFDDYSAIRYVLNNVEAFIDKEFNIKINNTDPTVEAYKAIYAENTTQQNNG